jgi:hypothetical protein
VSTHFSSQTFGLYVLVKWRSDIQDTSTVTIKVIHDGMFRKRELGSATLHGSDFGTATSGPQCELYSPRTVAMAVLRMLVLVFTRHLEKSGRQVGSSRLSFSVHISTTTDADHVAVLATAVKVNQASEAASALTDPAGLSLVSSAVDNATALAPALQTVYDDAQDVAEFYAPLGTVLGYLNRLMQVFDAASEASVRYNEDRSWSAYRRCIFSRFILLQGQPFKS